MPALPSLICDAFAARASAAVSFAACSFLIRLRVCFCSTASCSINEAEVREAVDTYCSDRDISRLRVLSRETTAQPPNSFPPLPPKHHMRREKPGDETCESVEGSREAKYAHLHRAEFSLGHSPPSFR
eukprot:scaffold79771_cov28-Tisochrysis_lutea.AAC.4